MQHKVDKKQKYTIDMYKGFWAVWYTEKNYRQFQPLELFVKLEQAIEYVESN